MTSFGSIAALMLKPLKSTKAQSRVLFLFPDCKSGVYKPIGSQTGGALPSEPTNRPGDGIGIRVGLRNQILGVRVSSGAPY